MKRLTEINLAASNPLRQAIRCSDAQSTAALKDIAADELRRSHETNSLDFGSDTACRLRCGYAFGPPEQWSDADVIDGHDGHVRHA